MIIDAFKVGVVVFIAAIAQTTVFSGISVLGGVPDVLLVTLVSVALVRGATTGAVAGFFAGLVVDIALLDTLAPSLALNLLATWPVFAIVRRLLPRRPGATTFAPEVSVVG